MNKALLLLSILVLASCRKKEDAPDLPQTLAGKDFELELIDSIPPKLLSGCGEYLTHDSIKGIAIQYLFVSDLMSNAMIRIDGRPIDLKFDTIKSYRVDTDTHVEFFRNDSIEVMIKLKAIERYDEGSFNQGVLTVTRNRVKKSYKVKGDSGC